MKKTLLSIVFAISCLACSNAQKKEFSKTTFEKKLTTLDNSETTFKEIIKNHKGKVVVLEIWASWCSDCVKAMPQFKELQAKYTDASYVFISMDKSYDKWLAGIDRYELKGDHYWVTDGMKGEFGKSIDLDWIPRYIIIDKDGKIATYRAVETDFEEMSATIKKLL